ncbi:MAG: SLBB domain-containing protein [Armatimonadetes bacterium]|nr:SLBB domain-containing protein [Armatimonadota bacterium]
MTPAVGAPAPPTVILPNQPLTNSKPANYTPPALTAGKQAPINLPTTQSTIVVPELALYGYDFFAQSRAYVDSIRAQQIGKTAAAGGATPTLNGTTGVPTADDQLGLVTAQTPQPVTLPNAPATGRQGIGENAPTLNPYKVIVPPDAANQFNVSISVPERYLLGPGDELEVTLSTPTVKGQVFPLKLDERGIAFIPLTSQRVVLMGKTIHDAEETLVKTLARQIKNVTVYATLKALRTFQITIVGESYSPGAYQVPSTITLFNALYISGGPKTTGTFRNIRVKRVNGTTHTFDFYKFMSGDRAQDIPLQPGDVVQIEPSSSRVSIRGEVFRAGIYEMVKGDRVKEVFGYAVGIKPTGIAQRISIQSIDPSKGYKMIDVNLNSNNPKDNPELYDGDNIDVYSVRPVITNLVSVEGNVYQPGRFALETTKPMTVADLLESARGPLLNTYYERADLYRLNPDFSVTLIHVNLGKAMQRVANENPVLKVQDLLHIYSIQDVLSLGTRAVSIAGAVNKPGDYYRPDKMAIQDLILLSGGLRQDAKPTRAALQRRNPDGTFGALYFVDLTKALAGNATDNIVLQDRDYVTVYTSQDLQALPEQQVRITGSVQRGGSYPYHPGMKVRDLIELAGNLTLEGSVDRAFIHRSNPDGTPGPLISLNVTKVFANDPQNNVSLMERDLVTLYSIRELSAIPDQVVSIRGSVQREGNFIFNPGMRVKDLVEQAGNVKLDAYKDRAFLQRRNTDGTFGPLVLVDLNKAAVGDPQHNIALKEGDELAVYSKDAAEFRPLQAVSVDGSVQRPGTLNRADGMRLKDALLYTGGLLPGAEDKIEIAHARKVAGTPIVSASAAGALAGNDKDNVILEDGDVIVVRSQFNFLQKPYQISVSGAVKNPGGYAVTTRNIRLSDIVKRAGGATELGYLKGVLVFRRQEQMITEAQKDVSPRLRTIIQLVQADEYKRRQAQADVEKAARIAELTTGVRGGNPLGASNQTQGATVALTPEIIPLSPVTPARALRDEDLVPSGNIFVDFEKAIRNPGGAEDIVLRDGDIVTIPERPTTVMVVGAVTQPSTILFKPGVNLEYYVSLAGGALPDADKADILLIRASGRLLKASTHRLEVGDIIFVPTRVMSGKLPKTQSDLDRIFGYITNGLLSYAIVRSIAK